MPHDVRAIANFVLDYAAANRRSVTNLALNKIVFFLHANYLTQLNKPLVSAKIEAWEYGPVFRELYQCFKFHKDRPIDSRAHRLNPVTGSRELCKLALSNDELAFLSNEAERLTKLSASHLVLLSHVKGGPWDIVWNHEKETNPSMRISDEIILAWHTTTSRH